MKTPVIIVGAGDLALELYQWVKHASQYEVIGFIDDNLDAFQNTKCNLKILSSIDEFTSDGTSLLMGISDPVTKLSVAKKLKNKGAQFTGFIHPTVIVADDAELGEGIIVCPNSVISTNVKIGKFVTINVGTAIGHDSQIDDGVTMNSLINICGNVKIGEGAFLGGSVTVIPNKKLGEYSKIAAGSVVFQSVKPRTTVAGNPAKKII